MPLDLSYLQMNIVIVIDCSLNRHMSSMNIIMCSWRNIRRPIPEMEQI